MHQLYALRQHMSGSCTKHQPYPNSGCRMQDEEHLRRAQEEPTVSRRMTKGCPHIVIPIRGWHGSAGVIPEVDPPMYTHLVERRQPACVP